MDKLWPCVPGATGRGANPERAARTHKPTRCSASQERPHGRSRGLEGGSCGGSTLQTSAPRLLCVMTCPADSPSFERRPAPRGKAHHTHTWCSQLVNPALGCRGQEGPGQWSRGAGAGPPCQAPHATAWASLQRSCQPGSLFPSSSQCGLTEQEVAKAALPARPLEGSGQLMAPRGSG